VNYTLFQDRRDAGRQLAGLIVTLPHLSDAIVLGLPRGGVPVAYEVARACNIPLDILVVRKLGAPGQRELALGAIASGGVVALNEEILRALHISQQSVSAAAERTMRELARMEQAWRGGCLPLPIEGRTAILVDDGLATGATMRAAVRAVRARASEVVIAVPVAAESACRELESEVDRVLCPATPEPFDAVGRFYQNFEPTSDEEVRALLADARRLQKPQSAERGTEDATNRS
jgi:predicted phosphoribosyltransferase